MTTLPAPEVDSSRPLPNDHLVDVYRTAQMIREVEETILDLSRSGEVSGSVHVCVGQEIVPAIICRELDRADRVIATYRGHGWALGQGVSPHALLSEVLGRATGTNGGRAGSAYLTAPGNGFIGENSIVGAGLPIANGVAMGQAARGTGVTVVSFGDGATNQGASHEALVFAIARNLPVLFVCENNSWSEMTPIDATVPNTTLANRARGYGMAAGIVQGNDIAALHAATTTALAHIRSGSGPYFLEIDVPRILGHYNRDIQHYRTEEDRAAHLNRDPIAALRQLCLQRGLGVETLELVDAECARLVASAAEQALTDPRPHHLSARLHVTSPPLNVSETEGEPEVKSLTVGMAANEALRRELAAREDVVLFGEDIAIPGGTFGVTRNLRRDFGERVFDTPISEAAILGAAVGASLSGLRPVVEIMWSDFMLVAIDQLINQAANVRYISNGAVSAPLVVRMQQGVTPGSCAQHSQSLEALLAHVPGLKVGLPSTAQDAYSMVRAAVADPDPVIIIESRALYQDKGDVDLGHLEAVEGARERRSGSDVLVVSWGRMCVVALETAEVLATEFGVEATVLDLRWLNPLDENAIATALERTQGKLLVVHEANRTGGFGAEIVARAHEFRRPSDRLLTQRVALPDVRVPSAPNLQDELLPSVDDVVAAALSLHFSGR